MRISSDENSKYYNKELGLSPKVYLDGELVKYAMEADDVAGWVKCCKLNEKGDIYLVYEDGTIVEKDRYRRVKECVNGKTVYEDEPEMFIAETTLYGKVEIKIKEE